MAALTLTYPDYIRLNGGEHCGICRRTRAELPDPSRKLDRDHSHAADGGVRGLLCRDCNRKLVQKICDPVWLRRAAEYLERRIEE